MWLAARPPRSNTPSPEPAPSGRSGRSVGTARRCAQGLHLRRAGTSSPQASPFAGPHSGRGRRAIGSVTSAVDRQPRRRGAGASSPRPISPGRPHGSPRRSARHRAPAPDSPVRGRFLGQRGRSDVRLRRRDARHGHRGDRGSLLGTGAGDARGSRDHLRCGRLHHATVCRRWRGTPLNAAMRRPPDRIGRKGDAADRCSSTEGGPLGPPACHRAMGHVHHRRGPNPAIRPARVSTPSCPMSVAVAQWRRSCSGGS